jgi:hypothetical protein
MGTFKYSGGVEIIGFISPTDPNDQYPVIDPLYGIDGFRNVNTLSDLNNIPDLRRRAGMVVGVSGGTTYYKLNPSPWVGNISDWSLFQTGGGGSVSGDYLPLSGGTVTGNTIFTLGLSANTISATTISGGTFYGNGLELTRVRNLVTVGLSGTNCDYSSIKSAVNSITDASATNTYVVIVGPGVFYEDTITMKSYVDVVGESATNTIIQANNPNTSLIVGADQSMVNNVQIQGCTGTSVAAIIYSSSTTPQLNAIFYVENVRFGANYTHVKNIGTGGGNSIIQCSNVKYGGYPFTLGFYCTNDGSGIGRMQLRNVTSTNGGVTTTTGLVFAKADKPGCGFIVNGCLLTKAVGSAAGTGFWVEDGGFLRLTGVNFQRWITGIYAPQTGSAPSIDAIALNFENCTTDVEIIHSGATGKIQGTDSFLKTKININAPLYEVNTDPRQITVAKKGADFTSIKSAVDYLISSGNTSSTNRYVITVGPGVFIEDEIDLTQTPYVSLVGSNIQTTQILPNTNSQHIIKIGINNEVSFLSLSGAPSGYAGIYCYDIGDYGQAHKVSFYDCDTNIWVESNTQDTKFYGEYVDFNGDYEYGTKVIGKNGYLALANMENCYNFPSGAGITYCNYATGSGATISVFVGDNQSNGVSGTTAFYIQDGAELYSSTITADGFTYGIRNPNVGSPIRFDVDNASFINGEWDLYVERNGTFGTFGGSSSHEKIYSISSDVYWAFLDIDDGEFDLTRKASVTFADGTHTDFTTLIFDGSTMGLMQGGEITTFSGFTVNIASGFGYLAKALTPEVIMRIDWLNSQITLGANENKYIYINENENIESSGGRPSSVNNIILGRVVTNSTGISFIDLSPVHSDHTSNRYGSLLRNAMGPIYAQGSIVTENVTPFKLDITTGEYYYSSNDYTPSGGTGVTFTQYIRNGSGGWVTSATTFVAVGYDDNSGTLSPLTLSAYTKHTLYVVGDGIYEKYFLVLGQDEYTTLVEAEGALLPIPPTFFTDSVSQIANIYIQQGTTGITQVEDIRRVIGFKAGGVNASSVHGNLLGLGADDHTQYLLVNGGRSMSGNLNMGGNQITNVGDIDGVDISSHATRHQFGGGDQVGTTTPSPNAIPYADVSGKLDSWISTATTSNYGKVKISDTSSVVISDNDLRFLKSFTGGTYSSGTLSLTNNSGGTFSISGFSVGSTFTGGTISGPTNFTNGLTANTISATTFTANTETIIGSVPTSATGSVTTAFPTGVYVQGKYAYIINLNTNLLQIIDISNPSSPVSLGSVATGTNPYGVYVQGRYAYVVNYTSNTLQIFDVSNPSSPVSVGAVSTGTRPQNLYVQGRYVYVVNWTSNTLQIFDVSNPSSPFLVGSVLTGTRPQYVYVQGRYAYVVNQSSATLQIFDISNPSSPTSVGSVSTETGPRNVYVQGRYAYVVNQNSNTLQIFDISNPSSPTSVISVSTGLNPSGVYIQGRYAYVVNGTGSNTLQIFDVSNPSSPTLVGSVVTGTRPYGLYVQGRYVYVVNDQGNSLQIFDVSGSYIQQLESGGLLTNTLESVGNATIGNDLAVVGGLNVSQSTNIQGNLSATNIRVVSGLTATTISATTYQNLPVSGLTAGSNINVSGSSGNFTISVTGVTGGSTFTGGTVSGSTNFTNGLSANTISATTFTVNTETIIGRVPTSVTGSAITGTNPQGVYVQGRYAYVVNYTTSTLQIFDVSNPFNPLSVGSVSTGVSSNPIGVYVQGRYAYVVNNTSSTLQIFDVSNPSSPSLVGSVSTGSNPRGVYVQGRYVYVVNYTSSTLQIFDVSNPLSPVSVGSISTGVSSNPIRVYVQGRYAYVINFTSESLQLFDISNPSAPVSAGSITTGVGSNPAGVYVQGIYAYVVNYTTNTLQIIDVSNPSSPVLDGSISLGFLQPNFIFVQGRYAYVTYQTSNLLQIIDVSNPSSLVSVGSVSTGASSNPVGVYVQGRYVYVVNYTSNRLWVFDFGGSYIQQLEVGGLLTNTLETVGNVTIGNNLAVVGGLNVSQSTNILGDLSSTNMGVVSGLTSNTISATTISATTISATTISATTLSSNTISATTISSNTISATTISSNILSATTISSNILSSNTISATTYSNLPTDVRVTGGTYFNGAATFTNNTGGTFSVTGFITGGTFFTGGTVTGLSSVDFGFTGGGESDYAYTVVSNPAILLSSIVMYSVIPNGNHQEAEDSLLDGLMFKTSDIVQGVGFTINCYSLNNTWGTYDLFYKIIN